MTRRRRDRADTAMTVLVVVPGHEVRGPLPGGAAINEALGRECGAIVPNRASMKGLSSLTRGRE
jgi:hypothetical protein